MTGNNTNENTGLISATAFIDFLGKRQNELFLTETDVLDPDIFSTLCSESMAESLITNELKKK